MIRRGTIFARHGRAGVENVAHMAVFGIVEADAGAIQEDVVHGVAMAPGMPFTMMPTGHEQAIPEEDYSRIDSVEGLLRAEIWPRPQASTGLTGGGIVFRRTRAPAAEGRETWIVVGAMSIEDGGYGDATMHDIAGGLPSMGGGAAWISASNGRPCPIPTNGMTPAQILGKPIWGWDPEPWGLFSTLRLDAQDVCMEILELRRRKEDGTLDETGKARLEKLAKTEVACIVTSHYRDEDYETFRRALVDRVGLQRWDRVRTRADLARDDEIVRDIIVNVVRRAA